MNAIEESNETTRRRAWLASLLMRRGSSTLDRLAACFERLRHAPRPWRRRLQRQLAATLTGAALLLALVHAPAGAANITVFNGEVNVAANGKCSLREAIINANNGNQTHADCAAGSVGADTIDLPSNGSFLIKNGYATVYYSLTGLPTITDDLIIEGHGATIRRDTATKFRLMAVDTGIVLEIHQTTLSNGHATGSGGAIYSNNGDVRLHDSTISGNAADGVGGGIYQYGNASQAADGAIAVTDSTFRANEAGFGGAIHVRGDFFDKSTVDIDNSLFEGNQGGAIYSDGGDVSITASTFAGNSAIVGGAIGASYSDLTVSDSTLNDNTASVRGGGVWGETADITIVNSTLSGNNALASGGGIYTEGFALTVLNSTVTANEATLRGGGIYATYFTNLTLERSLVSGNSAPNGPEIYLDGYSDSVTANKQNLFGHSGNSGVVGFTPGATDIVPSVSLPAIRNDALADNGGPTRTHALVADSPALDAAPKAACNAAPIGGVDQRGLPRNANGKGGNSTKECDIGAFEAQGVPPAPARLYVSPTATGMVSGIDARPEDILSFDPVTQTWSMHFDGGDVGLDKALSAFSRMPNGDLLLTFKVNATLPGVGAVTPWDVVRFTPTSLGDNTAGTFSWYIDGSDVGLTTAAEKIDALDVLPDDRVLVSSDGALSVPKPGGGAIKAQDEDLAAFTPTTTGADTAGAWALYFDGTAVPGLKAEDVGGAAVDAPSGNIYVVITNAFNVAGVSGDAKDIVLLRPTFNGFKVERHWRGPDNGFNLNLGGIERQ